MQLSGFRSVCDRLGTEWVRKGVWGERKDGGGSPMVEVAVRDEEPAPLVLAERQRCSSQAPMERMESSFNFLTRRFCLPTPYMVIQIITTFPGAF